MPYLLILLRVVHLKKNSSQRKIVKWVFFLWTKSRKKWVYFLWTEGSTRTTVSKRRVLNEENNDIQYL